MNPRVIAGVLLSVDEAEYIVGALDQAAALARRTQHSPSLKLLAATDKLRAATANASRNARNSPSCAGAQRDSGDADDYAISTARAAAILGVTPNAVRDLARRGALSAERAAGRWVYPASAVVALAERRAAQRK